MEFINKNALLKSYYQPDEKLLLAKVLDQADLSLRRHIITFSDFLSPAETAQAVELLKKVHDLSFLAYGGYNDCERKMLGFYPDYMSAEDVYFPITAVKIKFNPKFSSPPSHRDYLGSVLGMGIERGKVGDIAVVENGAVCFIEDGIADYVVSGLERVGHTKVTVEKADITDDLVPQKKMVEKNITVASMRADVIFGAVFNESRESIKQLINAEKASVNWLPLKSVSAQLNEGDVLSLKGSGRGVLILVNGETKKGRISIKIGKYV